MSDTRGWGRAICDAVDPDGRPCALEAGHEGNHLTATQTRTAGDYLVQLAGMIFVAFLAWQGLGLFVAGGNVLLFMVWLWCGIISAGLAHWRGANGLVWFTAGAILGPIGLAYAAWTFRR